MQDEKIVARIPKRPHLHVGKPRKLKTASMRAKIASCGAGSYFGGGSVSAGGLSVDGLMGGFPTLSAGMSNIAGGSGGNVYSPQLSTDFLELPQSRNELRSFFRFMYENDPLVGQAVDVHTEIPLSKVRFGKPRAQDRELAKKAQRFCTKWGQKVGFLQRLEEIVHEWLVCGEVFIWLEDTSPDEPEDLRYNIRHITKPDGTEEIKKVEKENADELHYQWLKKNYKGWDKIMVIPPEQVHMESFNFTDKKLFELIIDSKTKEVVRKARSGDERAMEIAETYPAEVVSAALEGKNVPLPTDPYAGSCLFYWARKRSPYRQRGYSFLQRVLRALVHKDKLRQAQASIASRHMTPMRVVTAEDASPTDLDNLRDQIDLALIDPDYTILTNFNLVWNEMGSDQRLIDVGREYDVLDRQMYSGLGVTESLLTGESSYSGERINIEVLNTRYMLMRETIQELVQEIVLKPMCYRMGFIEEDEDGEEVVIVPPLSFTRMALRDNNDVFDALYNLFQKGNLDIYTMYDLLNLDGDTIVERLKEDLWTFNDANFNEALRSVYSRAGDELLEKTNVLNKIASFLGLTVKEESEETERW